MRNWDPRAAMYAFVLLVVGGAWLLAALFLLERYV
jgi:hypothetical protein